MVTRESRLQATLTLRDWTSRNALLLLFLALCAVLAIAFPTFLTANNWILILQSSVMVGVMAIGLAFVMVGGGFDLSFAATMLVCGSVAARFMIGDSPSTPLALIVAPLVGGAIGLANGSIVVLGGISPLLGTIANAFIIRALGVLYVMETWMEIPVSATGFLFIGQGSIGGVPASVYIFIAIAVIAYVVLSHTGYGRMLFAIGTNPRAARVAGLPVPIIQIAAYGICGFCAGVAGVVNVSSVGGLSAVFNISYLYDVITAVVIGGVSFFGGIGSIYGVMLGVLILGVLKNAMVIMNMPHYTQNAVGGVFLIIAIGVDSYLQKLRDR
ncbi:MAG: ABC transporter permease [Alphaproteobacteria bacterium]